MGVDRLDAQLLLARVLACPRSWLLAHDDVALDTDQTLQFQGLLTRCADGEPLAYLLGEKEFHGLTLQVNPDVLVPRSDTEVLVDWAIELLADELARFERPTVVDLGTGSGAIALAVKNRQPGAAVSGTDNSPAALVVARANALRLSLDVAFLQGSWWQPVQGRRFHLALSNPPYIAAADPHLNALRHEPASALTPGGDGLDALRHIVRGARQHLMDDHSLRVVAVGAPMPVRPAAIDREHGELAGPGPRERRHGQGQGAGRADGIAAQAVQGYDRPQPARGADTGRDESDHSHPLPPVGGPELGLVAAGPRSRWRRWRRAAGAEQPGEPVLTGQGSAFHQPVTAGRHGPERSRAQPGRQHRPPGYPLTRHEPS